MKSRRGTHLFPPRASLPVRGAWIEIHPANANEQEPWSLPVRGAWIEIYIICTIKICTISRSPCGERGLK